MKNKRVFMLLPILSIALTSCGQVKKYSEHLEDYIYAMKYHQNFNILQLTDIHWDNNSSTTASKRYLEKVLEETHKHIGENGKIDLVEITGDLFMLANSYHVDTFVSFFEKAAVKYGFNYTVIWGNHDRHGLYNPNWLSNKFKAAKHCIYIEQNDDLYGRSNFVINLTKDGEKSGQTLWQIANLDSGASFSETAISPFRDYDYIRKDQTDWFVQEHALVGQDVPAIAYYHIPQQDNLIAYNSRETRYNRFFKLEEFADNGNPEYESDFITVARENNLKGAFIGHAHNIDWTVDYDGVILGLGVKTGSELYFAHIDPNTKDEAMKEGLASLQDPINEKFDLIGASLVTLTENEDHISGAFDLEHLYLNERSGGDFIRWEKF